MSRSNLLMMVAGGVVALFVMYRIFQGPVQVAAPAEVYESGPKYTDWQTYTPKTGNFVALFPTEPRQTTQYSRSVVDGQMRLYKLYASTQMDSSVFLVQEINFPEKMPSGQDDKLLNNVIADMLASNPNNELMDSEPTLYQGLPGIKFSIENQTDSILGITFIAQGRLYVLTRVSTKEHKDVEDFAHFVENFKLQENQGESS